MYKRQTVDGSFSERTMAMSVPYAGGDYKGNVTETQATLDLSLIHISEPTRPY